MKKTKKITHKNNSYRKLSISILIAITIFLTGSVYAATNFGVGPFSTFLPLPSINRVSDLDDPLVSNAVQKKANDAANLAVTKVARLEKEVKADPTPKKVKDLQEAQAEEVVAVNVSALAAKVVVDTNNSNTKTDLQFGSVADTAGVNSTYNALKAATEAKLIENNVIAKTSDSITINSGKMEDIKNQFANKDVKTNAGTCGTNGAPVLEGTWVSTGHPLNTDGSACEGGASCPARECMKCGKDGKYEDSQTCSSVLTQGQPVVLPQQAGKVYTGIDMTLSTCFSKVNGTLTQIAIGQSQGDAICAPTGSMIKKSEIPDDVIAKLNDYCKLNKQEWKDGKCQNSAISQESLNSELAKAKIAEAARQETLKNFALENAKKLSASQCGKVTYPGTNGSSERLAEVTCDKDGKIISIEFKQPKSFGKIAETKTGISVYSDKTACEATKEKTEKCIPVEGSTTAYAVVKASSSLRDLSSALLVDASGNKIDLSSNTIPKMAINPIGKLNSYAKAKADCKLPELATLNTVTGNWWCADESGSIDPRSNKSIAGDTCSYNSDCDSGDCRNITKPGTSYRAYYCMETHDDSRASLIWSANTTLYNTLANNKLENGQYCLGRSYVCKSNYCADNRFLDTCEDNPFVSESAKNTEQVHIENLQTKYELIIEKDPEAFTKYGRELGMQDCINNYSVAECIPIPGKNNKAVVEHAIDEAVNEYNINLP